MKHEVVRKARLGTVVVLGVASLVIISFLLLQVPVDDGEVLNPVKVLDPVEFDSRVHVVQACPLVFSGRSNFDSRQAVRDTWGAVVENMFFVVGERWCEIPPRFQDNASPCMLSKERRAEVSSEEFEAAVKEYTEEQEKVSRLLKKEQEVHADIILLNIVDSYGNLASKVRAGFKHALTFQNTSHCDWFMKIDDDAIILVEHFKSLIEIISSPRNAQTAHRVVGKILDRSPVQKFGKWAERIYKGTIYPPYPQGSSGYLVSKELVRRYIQTNMTYHNEDSTLGIWASENKHLSVTMEDQKRFFCSECTPTWCHKYPLSKITCIRFATLGHKHLADSMRRCYRRLTYPSHLIDIVKSSNESWFREIETLPNAVEIVEERLHDLNRSHFA